MGNLLIIFHGDWADEMDVDGFCFLSQEAWDYVKLEVENTEFPQEISVGTNEEIDYANAKEFFSNFTVKEISSIEQSIIQKFFGNLDFGTIAWLEGQASEEFYKEHGHRPK